MWKDIGGNQEEILSIEKFAGCMTEVKEEIELRERLALRNKVKEAEHLETVSYTHLTLPTIYSV